MGLHDFPYGKAMDKKPSLLLIAVAALFLTGCPSDNGSAPPATSSSGTVVYLADQDTVGVFELYLATSGTKLNSPLVAGGSVTRFALTPDGSAVIYIADQQQNDVFELWRVNLASPGSSTKLNGPLVAGGDVEEFAVTPDNSAVVYRADQTLDNVIELYRTVFSGGNNAKLNPDYVLGQNIDSFTVLPNSTGVIYRANKDTATVKELYRTLFATPQTADRLVTPFLLPGQNVDAFAPTADSASVVYIANRPVATNQVFIAPAAGGGSIQINGPLVANGNVTAFAITPDGLSVVYRADQDTDEVFELYRTVIASAPNNTKLNPPFLQNSNKNVTVFGVIPDSSGVVYVADQNTDEVFELFRTVFSGGNSQLNSPFLLGFQDVVDFAVFPNSTGVVYKADQNTDGVNEIYGAIFGFPGATRLNPPLVLGQNVLTYTVAPDSASAIYRANQDNAAVTELYRSMFSSPGVSAKLNAPPLAAGKNVTDFAVR